ncbi:MAG TPA: efflux RND transporter periplasmic adaptor subunit [Prolixibacteraceae bacterium]|nr:efflux RND transporter periplasmic adaptor subunit [Prolixibacteraceae bacterium]
MKEPYTIAVFILLLLFGSACRDNTGFVDTDTLDADKIRITRDQFHAVNMQLGNPEKQIFTESIRANGYLLPSPDGMCLIQTLLSGRVSGIRHSVGEPVKKGEILFWIEGEEVIALQEAYMKSIADLEFKEKERERVIQLVESKVSPEKSLEAAEKEYKLAFAEKNSLEERLKLMQVDPKQIVKGTVLSAFPVHSPLNGYLTAFNLRNGQFVDPQYAVGKIVDTRKLQLNLSVFENDPTRLWPGQKVIFYEPGRKELIHTARLKFIGREIDSETQSLNCIASIDSVAFKQFVNGLFVEGQIITSSFEALALPSTAVFFKGNESFVLVKTSEDDQSITLERKRVQTGKITSDFVEINTSGLTEVLVNGVYYLNGNEEDN